MGIVAARLADRFHRPVLILSIVQVTSSPDQDALQEALTYTKPSSLQ